MILVNLTLKIDPAFRQAMMAFIRETYLPAQLAQEAVLDGRLFRLLDQDESDGLTEVLQLTLQDEAAYRSWLEQPSNQLHEQLGPRFKDTYVSFQTAMELQD